MSFYIGVFVFAGIYGILAMSFTLVHGTAGMFTVAHAVFFGIGAYAAASIGHGLPPGFVLFDIIAAVIITVAVAVPVAVVALRERGQYMMLVTFSTQIVFSVALLNIAYFGGEDGLGGIQPLRIGNLIANGPIASLVVVYVLLILVYFLLRYIEHSALGRLLRAIREDELAAEAFGADVWGAKLIAFVASAGLAGFAGALFAHYSGYISPASFSFQIAILIVTISVLGGQYSMIGAALGAVVVIWMPYLIEMVGFQSVHVAALTQLLYGVLIIVILFLRPEGLVRERVKLYTEVAMERRGGRGDEPA